MELVLLPVYNWLKKITKSNPKAKVRELYAINGGRRKFLFLKVHSIVLRYMEG